MWLSRSLINCQKIVVFFFVLQKITINSRGECWRDFRWQIQPWGTVCLTAAITVQPDKLCKVPCFSMVHSRAHPASMPSCPSCKADTLFRGNVLMKSNLLYPRLSPDVSHLTSWIEERTTKRLRGGCAMATRQHSSTEPTLQWAVLPLLTVLGGLPLGLEESSFMYPCRWIHKPWTTTKVGRTQSLTWKKLNSPFLPLFEACASGFSQENVEGG